MKRKLLTTLLVFITLLTLATFFACGSSNDRNLANNENNKEDNEVISPTLSHSLIYCVAVPATCTQTGNVEYWHCTICEKNFSNNDAKNEISTQALITNLIPHDFGEWKIITEETLYSAGLKERCCSKCQQTEKQEIKIIDMDSITSEYYSTLKNNFTIEITIDGLCKKLLVDNEKVEQINDNEKNGMIIIDEDAYTYSIKHSPELNLWEKDYFVYFTATQLKNSYLEKVNAILDNTVWTSYDKKTKTALGVFDNETVKFVIGDTSCVITSYEEIVIKDVNNTEIYFPTDIKNRTLLYESDSFDNIIFNKKAICEVFDNFLHTEYLSTSLIFGQYKILSCELSMESFIVYAVLSTSRGFHLYEYKISDKNFYSKLNSQEIKTTEDLKNYLLNNGQKLSREQKSFLDPRSYYMDNIHNTEEMGKICSSVLNKLSTVGLQSDILDNKPETIVPDFAEANVIYSFLCYTNVDPYYTQIFGPSIYRTTFIESTIGMLLKIDNKIKFFVCNPVIKCDSYKEYNILNILDQNKFYISSSTYADYLDIELGGYLPELYLQKKDQYITEYTEYNDCYYYGTLSNPFEYFIKPKDIRVKEVKIHPSTIYITDKAFYGCYELESVEIPHSVKELGEFVFAYCYKLGKIQLSQNLSSIPNCCFYKCSSLTDVKIPSNVTNIRERAFYNCESLTSITIPSGVTSIGERAFQECSKLKTVTFGANSKLESIGWAVFSGCKRLTSITIPSSVTSIGGSAFSSCRVLQSIEIPSSVISIGERAFYECTALTSVSYEGIGTWYYTDTESHNFTCGTKITLGTASENATLLTSTYCDKYWYKID